MTKYAQRLPWSSLKRTETFITDGNRFMVFPDRVAKIITIADETEQAPIRRDDHFVFNFGATYLSNTGGRPTAWRPGGIVSLAQAPATDTTFTLTAGASEVFNVEVYGTVRDASESGSPLELYDIRETIAITSDAGFQTANAYVDLKSLSKDRSTTNLLAVVNDQSGKVVSRIMPQSHVAAYRRVEFDSVPAAGRQVRVEYFTSPDRIDSELQPLDPALNIDYLVWMAVGDLHWLLKETQNAQVAWSKADELLAQEANKERTFGENGETITPDFGYMNLEDWEFGI